MTNTLIAIKREITDADRKNLRPTINMRSDQAPLKKHSASSKHADRQLGKLKRLFAGTNPYEHRKTPPRTAKKPSAKNLTNRVREQTGNRPTRIIPIETEANQKRKPKNKRSIAIHFRRLS
jgi:hypothetical protein